MNIETLIEKAKAAKPSALGGRVATYRLPSGSLISCLAIKGDKVKISLRSVKFGKVYNISEKEADFLMANGVV